MGAAASRAEFSLERGRPERRERRAHAMTTPLRRTGSAAQDRAAACRAAPGSAACGELEDGRGRALWARELLGRPVVGAQAQHLGHVRDIAVRQTSGPGATAVSGVIADLGGVRIFAPAAAIRRWQDPQVLLDAARLRKLRDQDLEDEVLLRSIIGQPVMTRNGDIARVGDIGLRCTSEGWCIWAADTRSPVQRFLGLPHRVVEWEELVGRRLAPGPP